MFHPQARSRAGEEIAEGGQGLPQSRRGGEAPREDERDETRRVGSHEADGQGTGERLSAC